MKHIKHFESNFSYKKLGPDIINDIRIAFAYITDDENLEVIENIHSSGSAFSIKILIKNNIYNKLSTPINILSETTLDELVKINNIKDQLYTDLKVAINRITSINNSIKYIIAADRLDKLVITFRI